MSGFVLVSAPVATEIGEQYPTPWNVGVREFSSSAIDSHGNPGEFWGDPVDRPVYAWAPAGTAEPFEVARDAVTWDLDLYAPAGFSCGPRDRVVVDGSEFEVVGRVQDFTRGPFGWAPGVRVRLKMVEG